MTLTLMTIIPTLIYLCIIIAIAVAGIRLMWIAGSYLKRRQTQLP